MKRRVVITGLGLVTPLGLGVSRVWEKLIASESGIRKISRFQSDDLTSKVAGQVPRSDLVGASEKGLLNSNDWIEPKEQRKIGDYIAYGVIAAQEALEDANWAPETEVQKCRTGVMIGSGIGGLDGIYQNSVTLHEKGARRVSPFFIPSCLINLVSGQVSIKHGLKGPNHAVVTACSSGAHAIGDAARLIRYGDADVMVAGGAESSVCPLGVAGFAAMRALSTHFNDEPEKASRPWDQGHDGFVIGEGAGILVLEELTHALNRGAKIYAEVLGYGLSGDAHHISAPALDGDGAFRSMVASVKDAGIVPGDLGYINAHGTSTPLGDAIELKAIKRLLGDKSKDVSISSTKSSIGHLLGAAGAVEAIFSTLALQESIVPPTLNLENPITEAEGLDLVPMVAKKKNLQYAMSNSFGFGGTNASLILKSY